MRLLYSLRLSYDVLQNIYYIKDFSTLYFFIKNNELYRLNDFYKNILS